MKIRYGLVLAMAILLGATGCASGGGGGAETGGGGGLDAVLGSAVGQGERPRETENTRAAERALEDAEEAESDAAALPFYQQAMTAAEAAMAEDGTNPLAHRLAARAAVGLGDYEAAGAHYDRAAELRPLYEFEDEPVRERLWIDLYQQATPLVQSQNYEAAAEVFENANAIYSKRPEAMMTLGQIYAQLRRHDEAIENLDATIAFMESDLLAEVDTSTVRQWRETTADVPLLRAQVLEDAGRFEDAADAYRSLQADDPGNIELARGLARVLMQAGDEAGSLEVYQDLLSRPGLTGPDLYSIGIGFYQASDYEQAIMAFSRAAESNPRDRDALELWARSALLDSAYAAVPPVAEQWLELDPNSQNGYLILAQAANQIGDQETTREAVQAVEALEVSVDQLQLQRFQGGGGVVSGSVINKTLAQGTSVTLVFTFYGSGGDPIGSVTETVSAGGVDMAQVFRIEFDSNELVGGYSYDLTTG